MNPPAPNLAKDLIRIHKIITRSLSVGINRGNVYLQSGFPDPELQQGYSSYIHCLTSVLGSHHTGEDLIAFPAFRQVLPVAPYAQLTAEHHQVEMLLARTPVWMTELTVENPGYALKELLAILEDIFRLWVPHIQTEEQYFSEEVLNAVLSPEAQAQIAAASSQHSQEHSGPPYWVVPFIIYNLEQDERMVMASFFPPAIMNEMIPVAWKDQWALMKPYLLE